MRRYQILLLITILFTLFVNKIVTAESVEIKQQITSLECVVNTINSGVTVNILLSPEECKKNPVTPTAPPTTEPDRQITSIEYPEEPIKTPSQTTIKQKEPTETTNNTIIDQITEDPTLSTLIIFALFLAISTIIRKQYPEKAD